MSFILDALKKSELERQRQAAPGFIEAPVAQRRRGLPLWVWIVGAVLIANVGVLSVLLWRSQRTPDTAAAPVAARSPRPAAPAAAASGAVARAPGPAAESDATAGAPPAADHFSPLDNAPVYAPEIPVDNAPVNVPAPRSVAPLAGAAAPRAQRRGDPVLSEAPQEKSDDDEVLPSLSELNLQGDTALQDLHIDVHVFASRPADRFVYINMRKYREGATLQEGPLLEHIRRDGVVLNYRGVRFLLPRQ